MNSLTPQHFDDITMTSREVAELTDKRHDHVLRDVRAMLDELEIHSPQIWGQYTDSTGRVLPEAHLDRDLTLTLVSGYSTALRYAIVKHMRALETKVLEQQEQINQLVLEDHCRVEREQAFIEASMAERERTRQSRAWFTELQAYKRRFGELNEPIPAE